MTRDEIIELANKCGDYDNTPVITHGTAVFNIDELERFANAIERRTLERAAKVCEGASWFDGGKCAAAIREMMER